MKLICIRSYLPFPRRITGVLLQKEEKEGKIKRTEGKNFPRARSVELIPIAIFFYNPA